MTQAAGMHWYPDENSERKETSQGRLLNKSTRCCFQRRRKESPVGRVAASSIPDTRRTAHNCGRLIQKARDHPMRRLRKGKVDAAAGARLVLDHGVLARSHRKDLHPRDSRPLASVGVVAATGVVNGACIHGERVSVQRDDHGRRRKMLRLRLRHGSERCRQIRTGTFVP
ncbi:hypothetical protein MRX96_036153 [Rhipicephalus microplus]